MLFACPSRHALPTCRTSWMLLAHFASVDAALGAGALNAEPFGDLHGDFFEDMPCSTQKERSGAPRATHRGHHSAISASSCPWRRPRGVPRPSGSRKRALSKGAIFCHLRLRALAKSPPVDNLVRHAACEMLKADAWAPAIERGGSSPLEAAAPAGVQGPICARKRCSGQHSAAARARAHLKLAPGRAWATCSVGS